MLFRVIFVYIFHIDIIAVFWRVRGANYNRSDQRIGRKIKLWISCDFGLFKDNLCKFSILILLFLAEFKAQIKMVAIKIV